MFLRGLRVVGIGALFFVVCGGVLASIFFLSRSVMQVGMGREGMAKEERMHLCQDEMLDMQTSEDAVARAQSYFNGENGYDVVCARAGFERALALDPKGSEIAWHQLGRLDFLEGSFTSALLKFDTQIEYFGNKVPNVHYMKRLTYGFRARRTNSTDDWASAEKSFRTYIALDPHSPWARTDLAWVLFSEGKFQDMKVPLEEGLLENPNHPWLLNMYGLALLNTGDREGAVLYFKAAQHFANFLSLEDWGRAYPGNDPTMWGQGLENMKNSIEKNLALALEDTKS